MIIEQQLIDKARLLREIEKGSGLQELRKKIEEGLLDADIRHTYISQGGSFYGELWFPTEEDAKKASDLGKTYPVFRDWFGFLKALHAEGVRFRVSM